MISKNILFATLLAFSASTVLAQEKPLKTRPDALPPVNEYGDAKALQMANTVDEMADWDRYPTYETYLQMMQLWTENFPTLCHIDTIGTSVQGRLILSMYIQVQTSDEMYRPEFFYTSTMHGDELTGFVMLLRLIDTLLNGYGNNQQYTDLINRTRISINPLFNPDGTYRSGNNTVQGSVRYNANNVDLNRNFPDPFGTAPLNPQQVETAAMIEYAEKHNFRLSANLHGGSEVMNYPWDSFTSAEKPHPHRDWWTEVCQRFVDTSRNYSNSHFRDVSNSGYIAGGDWYIIPNGRQDYMNYYHNCLEMTMEVSTVKKLSSNQLPEYWRFLQHSLVNYIEEIHSLPNSTNAISIISEPTLRFAPNPTRDRIIIANETSDPVQIYDMRGHCVIENPAGARLVDLQSLPKGIYILRCGKSTAKVVKK